jgi:hypothetical protein
MREYRGGSRGNDFDFETEGLSYGNQVIARSSKEIIMVAPPVEFKPPVSQPMPPKAPSPVLHKLSPIDSPTIPLATVCEVKRFRNIAEAYGDAPEDTADLDG